MHFWIPVFLADDDTVIIFGTYSVQYARKWLTVAPLVSYSTKQLYILSKRALYSCRAHRDLQMYRELFFYFVVVQKLLRRKFECRVV